LRLYLFGPPRIERDGEVVTFNLRKGQALLAYLAETGQMHSRDFLATLFWPDHDQASARGRLRRTLYRLGQALGESGLVATADTVSLDGEALWVDTAEARRLLAPPGKDVAPSTADLEAAVALYTGDFLGGFSLPDSAEFDEWQFFQQTGWRQLLARALVQLVERYQAQGAWEEAIAAARRWLALDALHEPAHRHLMTLYALAGQQAAALRQYEQCLALLDEELGVEPEEETTALYEAIRSRQFGPAPATAALPSRPQSPAPGPAALAPGPEAMATHSLPPESTPFVGREAELAALATYLAAPEVRLVTLVGPGGIGKTRLALAAARGALAGDGARDGSAAAATFADGAAFVRLDPLDEPGQVVPAIATAAGFTFESSPRSGRAPLAQLLHYLANKEMLLILDNFEHLLPAAGVVTDILQAAPGVKVLATTRERLYLREEHLLVVPGLDLPSLEEGDEPSASAAVRLFVQTAARVRPGFALTAENAADIVAICRIVDGLPLAVELAAAWVDTLSLPELAAEIGESLDILETNLRDVPLRQRSIRAVFETTWQRLEPDEQRAFMALSVFRGGFTRAAAAAVAGTTLRMLQRLAGKALLQYSQRRERYRVHELLRQCAADMLARDPGAEAAARDAHSAYFCAELRRWQDDIEGAKKRDALAAMDQDADNVQVAWQWALGQMALKRLEQAIASLEHWFYWRSRLDQGERFSEAAVRAVAAADPPPGQETLYWRVLTGLEARHANFRYLLHDWDEARAQFERGLVTLAGLAEKGADVRLDEAYILMKLADVVTGLEEAEQLFRRSQALYLDAGHRWWAAGLHAHLGLVALARGDDEAAQAAFAASQALYQELGDRWQLGWVLDGMSHVALSRHQLDEAERLARESLAIHREIGLRDRIADSLTTLSWITLAAGKEAESLALREEAMAIWRNLGVEDRFALPLGLEEQPFTPRWFQEVIDQRIAATAQEGIRD
jgi:predicted ATPase/DNA-binding SARP family transcriptional activator